ncbi:hypothetical protein [Sulfurovum riftiae]|nr:hypothetical protein [Sulfurovum riftiae]
MRGGDKLKLYYQNKTSVTMRAGWTLIELIFIIIVIGILAAMALPRLAATRDDAKLSTTVHNMGVCVRDISSHYTATGRDYNDTNHPTSCEPKNTKCYIITYPPNGGLPPGELNVTTNPAADIYCADIDNVGGHLARHYKFGGKGISR